MEAGIDSDSDSLGSEAARLLRYERQLGLPGFSQTQQERLFMGSVLLLGASFVSRTVAMSLAQSGVGTIKLASASLSELSSARQFLSSVETPDSKLSFQLLSEPLMGHLEELMVAYDVIVDGVERWQTKLLASDVAMRLGKPLVHSHSSGLRCQVYCMVPGRSMCLRCLLIQLEMEDFPREEASRFSSLPALESIVGGFQALEVIKLLSGFGVSQGNELMRFDGLSGELEVLRGLDPKSDCPDCGRP